VTDRLSGGFPASRKRSPLASIHDERPQPKFRGREWNYRRPFFRHLRDRRFVDIVAESLGRSVADLASHARGRVIQRAWAWSADGDVADVNVNVNDIAG
jgi:hypothetical protein